MVLCYRRVLCQSIDWTLSVHHPMESFTPNEFSFLVSAAMLSFFRNIVIRSDRIHKKFNRVCRSVQWTLIPNHVKITAQEEVTLVPLHPTASNVPFGSSRRELRQTMPRISLIEWTGFFPENFSGFLPGPSPVILESNKDLVPHGAAAGLL